MIADVLAKSLGESELDIFWFQTPLALFSLKVRFVCFFNKKNRANKHCGEKQNRQKVRLVVFGGATTVLELPNSFRFPPTKSTFLEKGSDDVCRVFLAHGTLSRESFRDLSYSSAPATT